MKEGIFTEERLSVDFFLSLQHKQTLVAIPVYGDETKIFKLPLNRQHNYTKAFIGVLIH